MSPDRRRIHAALWVLPLLGALIAAVCWAMPALSPQRDRVSHRGVPLLVDYTTSVTAEELGLPFYEGAEVQDSFAYAVTTEAGVPVNSYLVAVLISRDPAEKVVAYYEQNLPGRPKAEPIEDGSGKHYVLAVGSESEVRQVIVSEYEGGSRVRLVRATTPVVPARPVRPRTPHERTI
jgi:hypothetical protein